MALLLSLICSCSPARLPVPSRSSNIGGSEFYKLAASFDWKQRDSFALQQLLGGNMPSFLKKLVPVTTSIIDSNGKRITAVFYVTPDYVSIGSKADWARIPLTPNSAQKLGDSINCFLPTRKMVDDIYRASKVKLAPVPMFAFRDSTPTMYNHHLIIEGQRKGKRGLISGIKKDVVMSDKVKSGPKPNRVAIYGWHKEDGKAIQPLYTGHVNWYVDYSHGIRLIYKRLKVNGRWINYQDVLKHPVYKKLLCDEEYCEPYNYSY